MGKDKGDVVKIKEGVRLCEILTDCYGMEYFVSNKSMDFIICVNWYVIECEGGVPAQIKSLFV